MKITRRTTKTTLAGAVCAASVVVLMPSVQGATYKTESYGNVSLDFALIGDAHNSPDAATSYGAVDHDYYIGKYEITQGQWTAFLNAAAKTGNTDLYHASMNTAGWGGISRAGYSGNWTYSVTNGYKNRPVVFVSLLDAKRFCNWLTNQKLNGSADTENGIYDMSDQNAPRKEAEWQLGGFALPTEDEWYKAAYYDPDKNGSGSGGYWSFATQSDTQPTSAQANYSHGYYGSYNPYYMNEVNFFESAASAYGVVDMTGNVWERTDTPDGNNRIMRGAPFGYEGPNLAASSSRLSYLAATENQAIGFRIAYLAPVPEPSTYALLGGLGAVALAAGTRWRRRKS